jgi:hypothetical protein
MRITIGFIIILPFCCGCSEPTVNDQLVGDVTGTVALLDENGGRVADQGGASVTIEGLHTYHTLTDSAGNWSVHNIETGFYSLTFAKNGFMSMTDKNFFSFLGDGLVKYKNSYTTQSGIALSRPIGNMISLDALFTSRNPGLGNILYAHLLPDNRTGAVIHFFLIVGKNPGLTIQDPTSYEQSNSYGEYSNTSTTNISIPINYSEIPFKGFLPGQRIYVRAYSYYGQYNPFAQLSNKHLSISDFPDTSFVLSNVVQ